MAKKTFKVLSIDGGGVRGVIPARILSDFEIKTKRPISSMFDMIAGTSTGAILALGLACPGLGGKSKYSADEMFSLYFDHGSKIFSPPTMGWWGCEPKYNPGPLEEILKQYFGDVRMKDLLTDILVTSYCTERRVPFFFRSWKARLDINHDFPIWQVARATSAALPYFPPAKIEIQTGGKGNYQSLIDGGFVANNPSACALDEVSRMAADVPEILLVSIGTGDCRSPIKFEDLSSPHRTPGSWVLSRIPEILSILFDAGSSVVDSQLARLADSSMKGRLNYFRFDAPLRRGIDEALDCTAPSNLQLLRVHAEELIASRSHDINRLCDLLTS